MYAICCYAAELTQSSALALILQPLLHRKLPAWVYSHTATSMPWNGCESQMVPAEIYLFSSLVILQAGKCIGRRAPTSWSSSSSSTLFCHRQLAYLPASASLVWRCHLHSLHTKSLMRCSRCSTFKNPHIKPLSPSWSASQFTLTGKLYADIEGTVWP